MNRWHVYEYMKSSYMLLGEIPTRRELKDEFGAEMDPEEIDEGHLEFILTMQRFFPKNYFRKRLERLKLEAAK